MLKNNDMAYGWDSCVSISDDEKLEPGVHLFRVDGIRRGSFPGSARVKPAPKAEITLTVFSNGNEYEVKDSIILSRVFKKEITDFFMSLGYTPEETPGGGKAIKMDWGDVTRRRGRAEFYIRKWEGDDGQEHETESVKKYLPFDFGAMAELEAERAGFEERGERAAGLTDGAEPADERTAQWAVRSNDADRSTRTAQWAVRSNDADRSTRTAQWAVRSNDADNDIPF